MQNQDIKTIEEKIKEFCNLLGFSINDKGSTEDAKLIKNFINYEKARRKIATCHTEKDNEETIKLSIKPFISGIKSKFSESPIEDCMYSALYKAGLKEFQQQYEIGKYRVDFAFPKEKVVIEADGYEWHRENSQQIDRDIARDKYLARKGWRILRFQGIEIRRDIETCIAKIKKILGNL
jgi:very-short-patch-repair endonuclease